MADQILYLTWNNDSLYFSGGPTDYTWGETAIVSQVASTISGGGGSGGGGIILTQKDPLNDIEDKVGKKTTDEFTRIVIRVNGLEKTKTSSTPKITINHIKNTFLHFGIKVMLENSPVIKK